jgi:hypothetical protein
MKNELYIKLLEDDLTKLKSELTSYKDERNIWITAGDIKNSSGNLTLHLIGNLKYFIGAELGKTGYIRNREAEFTSKNIPVENLINEVDETIEAVKTVISSLTEDDYNKEYPIQLFGHPMTTGYFIVRLISHLGYHLGQINYHRRFIDK